MKQQAVITILGVYKADGERDVIEIVTMGSFYKQDGKFHIEYAETEASGFEGHTTTLTVEKGKVVMLRQGESPSQLVIESGSRHQCNYSTGYGGLTVGISGKSIKSTLTEEGGEVDFAYDMDFNAMLASENHIKIIVKPQLQEEQKA